MNVTCPSCQKRYTVDDARVPPSGVTIRCPNCRHTFSAKPGAAAPAPPPAAQPPARSQTDSIALPGSAPRASAPRDPNSAVALPGRSASPPPPRAAPPPGPPPRPAPPPQPPPRGPQAAPPPGAGSVGPDDPVPLPSGGARPRPASGPPRPAKDADSLDLGLDDTPPPPRPAPPPQAWAEPDDLPGLPGAPPPAAAPPPVAAPPPPAALPPDLPGLPTPRGAPADPPDLPGLPQSRSAPSRGGPPDDLPGLPGGASSGIELEDPLSFIDEHAGSGGIAASVEPELRVRQRGGQVMGPFGLERIKAMLRSGELTGNEDISPDGSSWRAMTSHPELNQAMNQLHASDPMAFGQVDLPIPAGADLPAPSHRDLPKPRDRSSGFESSDGLSDLSLDSGALPEVEDPLEALMNQSHRPGAASEGAPAAAPLVVAPPTSDDDYDDGFSSASQGLSGPYASGAAFEGKAQASSDPLEVGEVPELPPIWKTYRKPIIAFATAAAVLLVGVFSHLFTPWGAFGIPGLVEWALSEPPPPAPVAPPAPPPTVADPQQLAALFDEGTYEAYRSILATVEAAGPTLPDNRLAAAKAHALGALAFGPEAFPRAEAQAAIDALASLDLASTSLDSAAAAQLEVLKAQAALGLANENGAAFVEPLTEASKDSEDADLWWLLGRALLAAERRDDAASALARAVELDPGHAEAHAALGALTLASEPEAAGEHFTRALEADPERAHVALRAAEAFEKLGWLGSARRARRIAAEAAARGLPPEQRAPLLLEVVRTYDELGRLEEVIPLAQEAARLQPAKVEYVAAGAVADAAAGNADAAVQALDALLVREPGSAPALIARARARFIQQDVAKAFLDLEAARESAPKDPRIPLWEGRFNLELGKSSDAEMALRRAIQLSDSDPTPVLELGRVKLEAGDVEAAMGRAEAAVKMAPRDSRSNVLAGHVYARRGQIEEALKAYRAAGRLDRYSLDAKVGEANMLRERAERGGSPAESETLAEARALYERALELAPEDPNALFEYGRALELGGEGERALELYEKAAAMDRSNPRPHLRMTSAFLARQPPDVSRARKALNTARAIERDTGKQLTEVRFWEARVALHEGEVRDAISSMRQATEKEPRSATYQFWLGRALEKNGSLYEAIAAYEKAVTLNSRFADAQRALGWTELERHRFSKARKWFSRYQKTAPHDPSIWVDIGESWVRQNRDRKALAAFQKALGADTENPRALLQIGNILSRKGQERAALERFEQVIAKDPDHGEAWCLVGISRAQRRVSAEAKSALDRCLSLDSAPPDLQEIAQNILETPSP